MNVTKAEYFTFNVHNSMLLVGQTATGKSFLQEKLIERLVSSHTPNELQFVLLDMTGVDFGYLVRDHQNYVLKHVEIDAIQGLSVLDDLSSQAAERVTKSNKQPQIFICIEECDMATVDQTRFDTAVIAINGLAEAANIKIIYSTSRPSPDVISKQLIESFDLVLAGALTASDYEYLGVTPPSVLQPYEFIVTE